MGGVDQVRNKGLFEKLGEGMISGMEKSKEYLTG